MPVYKHIDVRILVNDQPLEEYLDPSDDLGNENEHIRYVRAEANQRFSIRVTWESGYAINSAPFLIDRITLDEQTESWFTKADVQKLPIEQGLLTKPHVSTYSFCSIQDIDGQWKKAYYQFGALGLAEDTAESSSMTPQQLGGVGTIVVTAYRGKRITRTAPYITSGMLPPVLEEVPEKMMKGRDVKNNIKYTVSNEAVLAPSPRLYDYLPIRGNGGKEMKFIFRYRTRRALQSLGCIPRSPSPEPDQSLIISRQDEMINQQKADIERLRMELERERNRSGEGSTTLSGSTARQGVKRERAIEDHDLVEVAPPPKRPAVTIDLTGNE